MTTMADTPSPHALAHGNNRLRALLLLALLALVLLAVALLVYLRPHATGTRLGVGDVVTLVKEKRVTSATIRDEDALVVGEVKPGRGLMPEGGRFNAELPKKGQLNGALAALLTATSTHVDVDHQGGKDHARVALTTLLPALVLTDLLALVLLTSPYGHRLHAPHVPRGRHDLPAAPATVQPADAVDLPPAASPRDLPAVPVEAQPDQVGLPVKRSAARKAPPRKRTSASSVPAAPAEVQPEKAPPVTRTRKTTPSKTAAKKAAKAAPAKARAAEDVLPAPRPTRRRTQP
jgi:hypothetical protein